MNITDILDKNISIFKKSNTQTENISSVEAFNIFDILRARYNSIETVQLFSNFIHDRDFSYLVDMILKDYEKQVNELEQLAKKHKIKVPSTPPSKIKISASLDQLTDKLIFRKMYGDLMFELYSLDRGLISSTYNDELRNVLYKFILSHLNNFNDLYKYGKTKGWIEISPSYKTYKPVKKEELSAIEANHLWDHLNLRYDQLHYTHLFGEFIHDQDLKIILSRGEETLAEQIKTLEELAYKYEVPLPEKPPAINEATIDPEPMEDKTAYRLIFKGIQEAIDLHIRAVIESITNDNLRKLFLEYFKKEYDLYDKYLKYGKAKGWSHISPIYKKMQ